MNKSTDVTSRHKMVVERESRLPQRLSEATGARRARWLACLTVCALFALSWSLVIALIFLVITAIEYLYDSLKAH